MKYNRIYYNIIHYSNKNYIRKYSVIKKNEEKFSTKNLGLQFSQSK